MSIMKKFYSLIAIILISISVEANEALWLRYARISPDGNKIAFVYKGDIYSANKDGSNARRLTVHDAYDAEAEDDREANKTCNLFLWQDFFSMPSSTAFLVLILFA